MPEYCVPRKFETEERQSPNEGEICLSYHKKPDI